jgi:2-enoate reductase
VPNPYVSWAPILPENVENPLEKLKKIKYLPLQRELDADIVIIATGFKPNDELYYQCVKENAAKEIYNVGDSFKVGLVFDAVRSAYRKALSI